MSHLEGWMSTAIDEFDNMRCTALSKRETLIGHSPESLGAAAAARLREGVVMKGQLLNEKGWHSGGPGKDVSGSPD